MDYQDFLGLFGGVKMRDSNRAMCQCPCHPDKKASLSIDKIGNKILLHCFAGCKSEDILAAVGLTFSDLFDQPREQSYIEKLEKRRGQRIAAIYKYTDENGNYLYEKIRFQNKDMLMGVYVQETESFHYGLSGNHKTLFHLPQLCKAVSAGKKIFYVEVEKDVLTLESLGLDATTAGSANDWKSSYASYFKNADVVILPDYDEPGQALAARVSKDLEGLAKSVKIINTSTIPKGDVSDYIQEGHTKEDLLRLIENAESKNQKNTKSSIDDSLELTAMENAEEKELEWLIPHYIPKRSITTMAGDGGSGKTSIWCEIAASISIGRPCFLIKESIAEPTQQYHGQNVLFFSAEDSFEYTLKRRLRKNGANLANIFSISISDDRFQHIRFDSDFLENLIAKYRPILVIFDPLQAFVPPYVKMCDRNAMRTYMRPLIGLGEKYDCTFLIIVHSNKQSGLWSRKRIADSADIWDISRSVLMVGETKERGIRYISHEKCNYGVTGDTVLFSLDDEKIIFREYTHKKDREFITEVDYSVRQAPLREEAKEFILDFLKNGQKEVSEMDETAKAIGIKEKTLRRAKEDLKKDERIKIFSQGFRPKKWYAVRISPDDKG